VNEERGAGLWNSAAAREWEISVEEISRDQRAQSRDDDASPSGSAGGIHERRKSSRQKNEGDDDESDECADDEAQDEGESILLAAEVLDQSDQTRGQRRKSYGWHLLKLNASTLGPKRLAHAEVLLCVGEELYGFVTARPLTTPSVL
jgi:hypothetical protein